MSDVTDLKAEVLLLRRENAELIDENKHLLIKRQHTEDVNAKLRELVETMHGDMREMLDTIDKGSDTWGFCRYYGELLDSAETRMRELGIEAD